MCDASDSKLVGSQVAISRTYYFVTHKSSPVKMWWNDGQLTTKNPGLAALAALAANLKIAEVLKREKDDRLDEVAGNFYLCRH